MIKDQLIYDLKLDNMLTIMSKKDDNLYDICKNRLINGYSSIDKIYEQQNNIKDMLIQEKKTYDIYNIITDTFKKVTPLKNYLNPRNSANITPHMKLENNIELAIHYTKALLDINERKGFEDKSIKDKFISQINCLKQLKDSQKDAVYHLTGNISNSLNATNIKIAKLEKFGIQEKQKETKAPFIFARHKSKLKKQDNIFQCSNELSTHIYDKMAVSLLRIIIEYIKQKEEQLLYIQEKYGFGVGAINLYKELSKKDTDICYPYFENDDKLLKTSNLKEMSLLLNNEKVIGNSQDLSNKQVYFITGANQGGKTTWIRSVGQAQLMAQCGLFVIAKTYHTKFYSGVYTHFPEEETISEGLLSQELQKIDKIVTHMHENALLLMNESFQTTTEYDGYEIAKEILEGFVKANTTVFFVTHNYLLSSRMYEQSICKCGFLKAQIKDNEERTFILKEGEPKPDAHAWKLYKDIVG